MKKRTRILLFIVAAFIALGVFTFRFVTSEWKPPAFFPLADTDAIYTITKIKKNWHEVSMRDPVYMLQYRGKNSLLNQGSSSVPTEIYVGSSLIPLEQFVDKSVRVEGEFVYRDTQCVSGIECVYIGNYAMFNMTSIRLE